MTAHTPGPWKAQQFATEKKGFIAVVGPGEPEEHICDVFPFGKRAMRQSLAEHLANAQLIAAAPAMLKALKDILECPTIQNACGWYHEMKDARAAVAMATGSTPESVEARQ